MIDQVQEKSHRSDRRETSMKTLVKMLTAAAALVCAATAPALAQDWPQKTIRFIVPFPPGGGTDVVARMVAKNLQDKLGQTIIVENRGGANGAIGLMAVKQTVHDGYTFAFTSDTPMTVNPGSTRICPMSRSRISCP
jgi:Uncharacterized protein conserved in bacteria